MLLAGGGVGAAAGPATASAADGTLTVQVLRDFFGTGVINATMDVPQRGMKVEVSDPAGHAVSGVTDATGKVVVPHSTVLSGGQYRVDVGIPAPYSGYLRAAPAATSANHFDSFTSFVDVSAGKNASVVTGVWDPADYTLPDSRYFVPVQNGAGGADTRALVAFGTDTRRTCPTDVSCPATLDTQAQVGTTFGLAYDKYRGRLFQSAFARRYAPYGPKGPGAIYTVPTGSSGAPELFAQVPDVAVTQHDTADMLKDPGFIDAPGKESIGGLALSEDGRTLYAVNLRTRSLVAFDATGATASAPRSTVRIPDPGCASSGDWRPFGLSVHDNTLYVGGVCDAESTQQRTDLKAVVYAYDGKRFTTVLTHALTDKRGAVIRGAAKADQATHWNPWNTSLATWDDRNMGAFIDPQPELASLAFTRDGSMILGFRDRFMDVLSAKGLDPRPGNNAQEMGMSGGDINMACADPAGGYAWEGTGNCPNHATPANDGGQDDGVVEYFPGDFFAGAHQETALGSVAYIPRQQWVVSTEFDPTINVESAGTGYYDVTTGQGPGNSPTENAYQFVGQEQNGFGKAGGLGDIAYAAANAPIQIGNLVWFDGDHNGIQDPAEVKLPGATVNLLDASGKKVATTRTDADGEYYFGGVGAAYELTPGAKYTVQFDVCTADTGKVPGRPPASELRFTLPRAGADRAHDSNVTPPTSGQLCNGYAPVTAPDTPGGVDHTIDAGVYVPKATPPPSSPPSSPPASTPPSPAPPANPAPPGGSTGSLAHTGTSGVPQLVALVAILVGAGSAITFMARKRRARKR
ncbi:Cna B domain-containing protein (plasmid) [Streptantibioticus cattleyicolor NRRL 8057 = DSM 46488]|uniref:Cna B domain-containing protein n=1 Tax=Streptantibioticus cattleyicolor (strain ATCC 35852 / DSM 46488 / JCM 4925 / NBRC 14057 / NRRL 8057) TaxID=1003195 RepID=G8XHK6_STREN|nr:Cna B domain-containing protein [Streptantibioticus cattleyicolor NRRL 8057 = DSM 46488]